MFRQGIWVATFCVVLLWSAIEPKDYYTWLLEVLPAIVGFAVLVWTRRSFPLGFMAGFLFDTQTASSEYLLKNAPHIR